MAKNQKVKWAVTSEPADLPDFLSNDEIIEKHGKPAKGTIFRMRINKITAKENTNGDQRLSISTLVEEKGKPKSNPKVNYNNLYMLTGQNVSEQGAPYVKKFLKALGLTWNDFKSNTIMSYPGPKDDFDVPTVVSIGDVKFGAKKPVIVYGTLKSREYNDEDRWEVARWIAEEDVTGAPADADDDDDEPDDDIDMSDDEDDESDDADDDDEGEDEAEEELRDELGDLSIGALRKRALRNDEDADLAGVRKADLIDLIVEQELGDEDEDGDEDDDDDESSDEDELREELAELDLPALKKRNKDNGRKLSEYKGKKKPALIDMIVADEAGAPPF